MDTRPLLAEHIRECDDPKGEADRFVFEQNPGWDQMKVQKVRNQNVVYSPPPDSLTQKIFAAM